MKILNAERDDYGYEMIIYDLIEVTIHQRTCKQLINQPGMVVI